MAMGQWRWAVVATGRRMSSRSIRATRRTASPSLGSASVAGLRRRVLLASRPSDSGFLLAATQELRDARGGGARWTSWARLRRPRTLWAEGSATTAVVAHLPHGSTRRTCGGCKWGDGCAPGEGGQTSAGAALRAMTLASRPPPLHLRSRGPLPQRSQARLWRSSRRSLGRDWLSASGRSSSITARHVGRVRRGGAAPVCRHPLPGGGARRAHLGLLERRERAAEARPAALEPGFAPPRSFNSES